jgi:hypothetical protein
MTALNSGRLAFDELRRGELARPAAEKFAGAWLACYGTRQYFCGVQLRAFGARHRLRFRGCSCYRCTSPPDGSDDQSVSRQATLSAVVTLVGDVFAHPSHFGPQWAEPVVTAAVSAAIAVALWYAKRWLRLAH